ncbi:MAG: lamin tail domain-containing protein [Alphaproteobacteria bacterium]|nr:lamin tail domain-containing protein [Alphaproteobacteria bacterium]
MNRTLSFLAILAFSGCVTDESVQPTVATSGPGYVIEGQVPADVDIDALVADLPEGGFGVVAHPGTGEIATIISTSNPLARDASGEFSVFTAASCTDCGDPTCASTSRTIAIELSHDSGINGETYSVQTASSTNFSSPNTTPNNWTADVGSTVSLSTTGTLPACNSFSYFFDVIGPDVAGTPNPVFTEYVEGPTGFGSEKYVEVTNYGGGDLDLSTCEMRLYANGSLTATTTTALSGTLAAGSVAVFCNGGSALAGISACTTVSAMNFNGNDAVELFCDGSTVDVIGQIGFAPPSGEWGVAPVSTKDSTIRRMCDVTTGDTNGADDFDTQIALEWDGFVFDITDLGANACL